MLQEGDPGFRGSLEYLEQSTGDLHQAVQSPGKAGGWTMHPGLCPCPLHPHSQELEPAAAAALSWKLKSFCLCIPKGTQAPCCPLPGVPGSLLSSLPLPTRTKLPCLYLNHLSQHGAIGSGLSLPGPNLSSDTSWLCDVARNHISLSLTIFCL